MFSRLPCFTLFPYTTLFRSGLMVVGDAGGHSNPLLGEGIRHVIVAARRAAPVAIAALGTPGLVPRERLRAWERRSEEHTSELQSRENLVCRLLLEKKN